MSARDRIVLGAIAVVAALAAFWMFALSPKRKAIAAAETQVAAQQQRLDQARSLIAGAQAAKRRYAVDYATLVRLGTAVPADDATASLVYELQSAAAGAKVRFREVKLGASSNSDKTATPAPATATAAAQLPPGAIVGTAGLATMPFSFTFEGSYLDMQRLLQRVDRFVRVRGDDVLVSGRLLTVDGLSLANSESAGPARRVKATISATAYLAPDAGTSGTASAPSSTPSTGGSTGTAGASGSNTSSAVTASPAS